MKARSGNYEETKKQPKKLLANICSWWGCGGVCVGEESSHYLYFQNNQEFSDPQDSWSDAIVKEISQQQLVI